MTYFSAASRTTKANDTFSLRDLPFEATLSHDSTSARVGPLSQPLVHDTTAYVNTFLVCPHSTELRSPRFTDLECSPIDDLRRPVPKLDPLATLQANSRCGVEWQRQRSPGDPAGSLMTSLRQINYHPQSGWFDEGPSKGPPPCGRGLKPPEVLLLLVFFLFLLVADVVPNNGLV